MAAPFPTTQPGDVWGQALINAITDRDADTLAAANAAVDALEGNLGAIFGAPSLVLGPQDPVPANTPAGTIIFRTT